MVFIKLAAWEKHAWNIPNTWFNSLGWLRLNQRNSLKVFMAHLDRCKFCLKIFPQMSSEVINTRIQDSEENLSRLEIISQLLTISVSRNYRRKVWDVSTEDTYNVACLTYCSPCHVSPGAFVSSVSRNCHNFLPLYFSPYAAATERKGKLTDFTFRAVYTLMTFLCSCIEVYLTSQLSQLRQRMNVNVNNSYISVPMIANRLLLMAHIYFTFYGRIYFLNLWSHRTCQTFVSSWCSEWQLARVSLPTIYYDNYVLKKWNHKIESTLLPLHAIRSFLPVFPFVVNLNVVWYIVYILYCISKLPIFSILSSYFINLIKSIGFYSFLIVKPNYCGN